MDDCCRLLLELLLDGLQLAEDVGSLRAWARSPEELQRRLREQLGVPEPVLACISPISPHISPLYLPR